MLSRSFSWYLKLFMAFHTVTEDNIHKHFKDWNFGGYMRLKTVKFPKKLASKISIIPTLSKFCVFYSELSFVGNKSIIRTRWVV